jgi:hypothetical protein
LVYMLIFACLFASLFVSHILKTENKNSLVGKKLCDTDSLTFNLIITSLFLKAFEKNLCKSESKVQKNIMNAALRWQEKVPTKFPHDFERLIIVKILAPFFCFEKR